MNILIPSEYCMLNSTQDFMQITFFILWKWFCKWLLLHQSDQTKAVKVASIICFNLSLSLKCRHSNAHLYYFCWRKTVGPNIFRLPNRFHLLRDKICRSNKRDESGPNKWLKSQTNTNSFPLFGVQNCCITTLFSNRRKKGLLGNQTLDGTVPSDAYA